MKGKASRASVARNSATIAVNEAVKESVRGSEVRDAKFCIAYVRNIQDKTFSIAVQSA